MAETRSPTMIGYVLKRFPVLSETFVLNEIIGLESTGIPVHIFALERPNDPRFHEALSRLQARISYVPDLFQIQSLLQARSKARELFGKDHGRTFAYVLKQANAVLCWRYLQSSYVAVTARRLGISQFHAHFATRPTTVAFLASMMTRIPYSFTAHAMDIYKNDVRLNTLARKIEQAQFVVTVTDYNKRYLERIAPKYSHKIVRIYNGVHLDRFRKTNAPVDGPFTFLCVARFVEKKGHTVLVDACHRLRQRGLRFRCLLAGRGPLQSDIERRIKDHRVEDVVELLGALSQNEVLECYENSHAFVLPCVVGSDGNRDGLPVSVVEALACGLPVISTPVTGIPEVVRHERNGLLVPSNDADALSGAMENLIADSALFQRLRVNARNSVERHFDADQTISCLKMLFERGALEDSSGFASERLPSRGDGVLQHV